MNQKITHSSLEYFKSYSDYFWSWEEHGEVIQSQPFSTTIGYREDIVRVLEDVSHDISPRFGSVLLIIYACSHHFKPYTYDEALQMIRNAKDDDTVSDQVVEYHVVKAFKLLKTINALPDHLKKGQKRVLLLAEILKENKLTIPNYSEILKDFNSGNSDDVIFKKKFQITYAELLADFHVLSNADNELSSTEILQEKLETGVIGLQKQDLPLEKKDILAELLKEKETAALSDLAKHFMGSLKIPIHLEDTSDISLGGVSDVSNKGDFDKLLLSELAYSDDVFLSRLINNEALYFKREASPENLTKNRIILLDATIKVWGSPRLLALALTLAFKFHPKSKLNTKLILLDGESYLDNAIDNVDQIKEALKFLSPYLDCSLSLNAVINSKEISKEDEVIFVIEESNFYEKKLQKVFNLNKKLIDFLVTIKRDGLVNYFSIVNESLKKLGKVTINMEQVVNTKRRFTKATRKTSIQTDLPFFPAFYDRAPTYPILHCATQYHLESSLIYLPNGGAIVKTRFNELVYYPKKQPKGKAGYTIKNNTGNYKFNFTLSKTKDKVYFLTYSPSKLAGFSVINLDDFSIAYVDLKTLINKEFRRFKVTTHGEDFYIHAGSESYIFNRIEKKLYPVREPKSDEKKGKDSRVNYNLTSVETPFVKMNIVRITTDGCLVFNAKKLDFQSWDKNHLHFAPEHRLVFKGNKEKHTYIATSRTTVLKKTHVFDNPKIKFRHVSFKDGSEILFDNKGFAHLKSSDKYLPEITVKMQLNAPVSIYVSTGEISAQEHLINDKLKLSKINAKEAHKMYLQPFIQNIINAY